MAIVIDIDSEIEVETNYFRLGNEIKPVIETEYEEENQTEVEREVEIEIDKEEEFDTDKDTMEVM